MNQNDRGILTRVQKYAESELVNQNGGENLPNEARITNNFELMYSLNQEVNQASYKDNKSHVNSKLSK
jgi:hypothetical protein